MKSARAKMKAALNEQARHARGEPTQEDREREKYKRYRESDKGKARYQTYWSSDKGKQVLKQYKTSRKTQQKDDRTKVMELRDAALSIGRPVRDVAPQTGHAKLIKHEESSAFTQSKARGSTPASSSSGQPMMTATAKEPATGGPPAARLQVTPPWRQQEPPEPPTKARPTTHVSRPW